MALVLSMIVPSISKSRPLKVCFWGGEVKSGGLDPMVIERTKAGDRGVVVAVQRKRRYW
jgi:hypothetical protein